MTVVRIAGAVMAAGGLITAVLAARVFRGMYLEVESQLPNRIRHGNLFSVIDTFRVCEAYQRIHPTSRLPRWAPIAGVAALVLMALGSFLFYAEDYVRW